MHEVLVDGAHAVGALDLDIPSLGVDFYTANLHKWLCTPKGTAFLWVAPSQQPHIRPLVTSHGFGMVRESTIHTFRVCTYDYPTLIYL